MKVETISLIASSTVLATILSSIINFWINKTLKKNDFRNEYFKLVIKKRLEVYENLEKQVYLLKTSMLDENDGLPYHRVFSLGDDFFLESTKPIWFANSAAIWINDDTREKVTEFIQLINNFSFQKHLGENYLIELGKKHYWKVAKLRDELELLIQRDILTLYDFSKIQSTSTKIEKGLQFINIKKSSR